MSSPRTKWPTWFAVVAGSLVVPAPGRAAAPPDPPAPAAAGAEFFENKVRPVLVKHCQECHGEKKQRGGLRVDSRDALLTGGDAGPALVPGSPEKSLLIQAVEQGGELKMPPKGMMPAREVADLKEWVKRGAVWPAAGAAARPGGKEEAGFTAEEKAFWCFRPPVAAAPPAATDAGWVRSPIDRFVLRDLEAKGLRPAPAADKRTLIRRATFDLLGLPPTPAEVEAFLADDSPDAFAKLIDRLLASPHYGERWGRHWLDVARYADSVGATVNHAQANAWRYRDYVIRSFNADKPFDRFLTEQLAGDLLPADPDPAVGHERVTATGFLALGPKLLDELDGAKMQMDLVDEQVDTVGRAFLGLTFGCARCHDHKFDPVRARDYYALAGIFRSTDTLEYLGRKDEKVPRWIERPLAPDDVATKGAAHQKKVDAKQAELKKAETGKKAKAELDRLRAELKALEEAAPDVPAAMAVREGTVADVRVHVRGNHLALGPEVARGFPRVLAGEDQSPLPRDQSGRLELARWMTRPDHPLTARVIVNRVWGWHFGQGLVRTPDNFGKLGERPTHPELLDWLAVEFVKNGWSVKKLHRQIMLSAAYQTGTAADPKAALVDPENRLLWRFNRRRLEAEAIRDGMLAAAGTLDRAAGGSLLRTPNRQYITGQAAKTPEKYDSLRRSVYLPVVRNAVYDFFAVFDFPEPSMIAGHRASTTVPTQALFLMNSEWVAARAGEFADRLLKAEGSDADRVRAAYATAYGRPPTGAETARAVAFLARYGEGDGGGRSAWRALCQSLLASNEFLYVD